MQACGVPVPCWQPCEGEKFHILLYTDFPQTFSRKNQWLWMLDRENPKNFVYA